MFFSCEYSHPQNSKANETLLTNFWSGFFTNYIFWVWLQDTYLWASKLKSQFFFLHSFLKRQTTGTLSHQLKQEMTMAACLNLEQFKGFFQSYRREYKLGTKKAEFQNASTSEKLAFKEGIIKTAGCSYCMKSLFILCFSSTWNWRCHGSMAKWGIWKVILVALSISTNVLPANIGLLCNWKMSFCIQEEKNSSALETKMPTL